MLVNPYRIALGAATLFSTVSAQTYSECNPLKKSDCKDNAGLTKTYEVDFKKGADSSNWEATGSGSVEYTKNGAEFTIHKRGEAPTLQTSWYLFYGRVEVLMRAAPGTGIVSSAVLLSDVLDEVDWEWLGGDPNEVQTNYFGKGNTATDDSRSTKVAISETQTTTHNYTIVWTEETLSWYINDAEVRTLAKAAAGGGKQYPQTPSRVKLGVWAGGDSDNAEGTIEWAGGETDYSDTPFTMLVESVKVTNFNPAESYHYSDQTGDSDSIEFKKVGSNDDDDEKTSSKEDKSTSSSSTKTKESSSASTTESDEATTTTEDSSSATESDEATSTSDDDETETTAKPSSSSTGSGGNFKEKDGATTTSDSTEGPATAVEDSLAAVTAVSKLFVAGAAVVAALPLL